MTKADERGRRELEALLEKAMAEAGVAEAVEAYEKAEAAYTRISTASYPVAYTTNSTSVAAHPRRG